MERDIAQCTTFVREQIKAAAKEGMDATRIRTYLVTKGDVVPFVKFTMPEGVTLDDMTAPGIDGTFKHGKIYGVDVHFHDDFIPIEGRGYAAKCELFIKTVERCGPNGEESDKGWRNYYYFLDFRPTTEAAKKKLIIHDTFSHNYRSGGRKYADQILDGHFCHVSGDKKRDTHIEFAPLGAVAEEEAFLSRKPRRPILAG